MPEKLEFPNPFRPGAGHKPPHLAGREKEIKEFKRLLDQDVILENMLLTGLRGTGKTVLLVNEFQPITIKNGWKWAGSEISESATIDEKNMVTRLLTDLSTVTSDIIVNEETEVSPGFTRNEETTEIKLNYRLLTAIYEDTPGLTSDKLKQVLEFAWRFLSLANFKGLVFAYDEAQNLADHADKDQFPLSVLLDVFQSIQRKGFPIILVLTGLPTLFGKLVTARTFSERMFHVVEIGRLTDKASRDAIVKPIETANCPIMLNDESVKTIVELSGGYPYFIQFICKEAYDAFLQGASSVPSQPIVRKLDEDFFAARWGKATDRQRELLTLIASLANSGTEFSARDISDISKTLKIDKPFSDSGIFKMLGILAGNGLVYKNRWGKYSLAVPLMAQFIKRESSFSSD